MPVWQALCCHDPLLQAGQQYSRVNNILLWKLFKILDRRNWPDMGCSKGSDGLALYAQRLPGVIRQEPQLKDTSLGPSQGSPGKGCRLHMATKAAGLSPEAAGERLSGLPCVSSIWPFLLFPGPSEAPTHFSVTSSGQKASSAVVWSCSGPTADP